MNKFICNSFFVRVMKWQKQVYHWHVNYFFTIIEPETKLKLVLTYICSVFALFLSYYSQYYFAGSNKSVFFLVFLQVRYRRPTLKVFTNISFENFSKICENPVTQSVSSNAESYRTEHYCSGDQLFFGACISV